MTPCSGPVWPVLLRGAVTDDRERAPAARCPALSHELTPRGEIEQRSVLRLDRSGNDDAQLAETEHAGVCEELSAEFLVHNALVEHVITIDWGIQDGS